MQVYANRLFSGNGTLILQMLGFLVHNFVSTLQVGSADALAFYLPGVVSQLGKVLHTSRTMISGAAGSTTALDQAVRALAEYLVVVLEDGVSTPHGSPLDDMSGFCLTKEKPLASFLDELRHLPAKRVTQGDIKDTTESVEKGIIISRGDDMLGVIDSNVRSLHVNRTEEWLAKTAAHVNKLLSATFPLVRYMAVFEHSICYFMLSVPMFIWNSFSFVLAALCSS